MSRLARPLGLGLVIGLVVAAALLPCPATSDSSGGFTLATDQGRQLSLADLRGRVVVLSFGYTHCPDVCPTTLTALAGLMRGLGPEATGVQVLFVTLDPERDTPERLRAYVRHFDPRSTGPLGAPSITPSTTAPICT
jgi:protein SCO1/2